MNIFLGADHNGFDYKQKVADYLRSQGHQVNDEGDLDKDENDDFPQFAGEVVKEVLSNDDGNSRGILICGSGQGMCMAANRFKGIRASLCWNVDEARSARNDDDSNVLCLSAKYTSFEEVQSIIQTWLQTPFAAAPRYVRRLQQLDELG
jgi:ribose 5-phosphate isomerase B